MFFRETIWNLGLSSDKPDTVDLKFWLFTTNVMSTEAILASVFSSGQETTHKIVAHMDFLTFAFINVVLEFPERPSFPIDHLVRFINTLSFLVGVVDVECLEIIDVEVSWWQELNVILWLLLLLLWCSCLLWCSLLLFYLLSNFSKNWSQRFFAHFDLSENVNIFWKSEYTGSPVINVLDRLHETLIKYGLESILEAVGDNDVSNGQLVSNKEFLSFKSGVHNSDVFLQSID